MNDISLHRCPADEDFNLEYMILGKRFFDTPMTTKLLTFRDTNPTYIVAEEVHNQVRNEIRSMSDDDLYDSSGFTNKSWLEFDRDREDFNRIPFFPDPLFTAGNRVTIDTEDSLGLDRMSNRETQF